MLRGDIDEKCIRIIVVIKKVETNETVFFFCCENSLEKEQWIGGIGI